MGKIQGKITNIVKNGGSTNGKPWVRYVFTIDGKDYSTFNANIGDNFKIGDFVLMEGEQKGKFWNMESMAMAEGENVVTEKVESSTLTNRETSMYVSYAKDLFIATYVTGANPEVVMTGCIKTIKQAIKAFS